MASLYKEFCHNIISRVEEELDECSSNAFTQNWEVPLHLFLKHCPQHWARKNAWLPHGLLGAQALICRRRKSRGIHCNTVESGFANPRNRHSLPNLSAEKEFRQWRVKLLTHADHVIGCGAVASGQWEQKPNSLWSHWEQAVSMWIAASNSKWAYMSEFSLLALFLSFTNIHHNGCDSCHFQFRIGM